MASVCSQSNWIAVMVFCVTWHRQALTKISLKVLAIFSMLIMLEYPCMSYGIVGVFLKETWHQIQIMGYGFVKRFRYMTCIRSENQWKNHTLIFHGHNYTSAIELLIIQIKIHCKWLSISLLGKPWFIQSSLQSPEGQVIIIDAQGMLPIILILPSLHLKVKSFYLVSAISKSHHIHFQGVHGIILQLRTTPCREQPPLRFSEMLASPLLVNSSLL